ncbi:hypothetical protein F5Y16DRAFT_411487 [Xylariaceae sp. FL0255]|nr:hypothetical protein F5Y16DRAFT_411487 [Xylariaceae sp. FL0255]
MGDTPVHPRPRYEIERIILSARDYETSFLVRRIGKLFEIFKYMLYRESIRTGEAGNQDISTTDVREWALQPFDKFFTNLAPDLAPPFEVTLRDYLFPDGFQLGLDVVDEKLHPRLIDPSNRHVSHGLELADGYLDDLKKWTTLYKDSEVLLSFENPEDGLFKRPGRVLIDNGQTSCFFKTCHFPSNLKTELASFKKIASANLDSHLNLCHLFGVVIDDDNAIHGLLLTYIDHDGQTLSYSYNPSPFNEQKWMNQLDATLKELHKAGIVWGDVKADNVLIDREDNAWVIDFGGDYTPGWVEDEMAGTIEGDLAGMAKIRKYIFQDE